MPLNHQQHNNMLLSRTHINPFFEFIIKWLSQGIDEKIVKGQALTSSHRAIIFLQQLKNNNFAYTNEMVRTNPRFLYELRDRLPLMEAIKLLMFFGQKKLVHLIQIMLENPVLVNYLSGKAVQTATSKEDETQTVQLTNSDLMDCFDRALKSQYHPFISAMWDIVDSPIQQLLKTFNDPYIEEFTRNVFASDRVGTSPFIIHYLSVIPSQNILQLLLNEKKAENARKWSSYKAKQIDELQKALKDHETLVQEAPKIVQAIDNGISTSNRVNTDLSSTSEHRFFSHKRKESPNEFLLSLQKRAKNIELTMKPGLTIDVFSDPFEMLNDVMAYDLDKTLYSDENERQLLASIF